MPEQRRLVTIVFADVVGSTALAEELDAEDVRAILSRYWEVAGDVVRAHGGAVAKLLGDGVLAVFGVPAAHGDDADRALDASLALRARVSQDGDLARLKLRIGVNTGEVLADDDPARGEIVGDPVNVAARVAAAAEADQILAAEATHRAATAFAYGAGAVIAAKGKSQPVRVWPVLGRAGGERRGVEVPFVGRESDLEQLALAARRAFGERRPGLVTVMAPPGMGKGRLAWELVKSQGEAVWVARAQCLPYGSTLAYGPLREMLLGLFRLGLDAPAEDVRRHIARVLGDPDASVDVMRIALTIAPEGEPDEQDRERVFAAWRRLLERLASERPVLIVLDDIHWASESLLDLIERAMQPRGAAALLVVCLARPELLERRPTWGGGRRNSLNLALEPLSEGEIATLVGHLLEARPPEAVLRLVERRSEGNPFFAGELVRSFLERGPLDLRDPDAVVRAMAALPETVQATILSRIDLLPSNERTVLQASAVVGTAVPAAALGVIVPLERAEIDAALEALVERDLMVGTAAHDFAFRNALTRDVAYQMLPRARRARDHGLVARWLEVTAGDRAEELASLVAVHYLEATRLRRATAVATTLTEEDEENRHRAVSWLARAARTNASAGAQSEAELQLRDAAAIAEPAEEILVQELLGEVQWSGEGAFESLARALDRWREVKGDAATGARLIGRWLVNEQRFGVTISPEKRHSPLEQKRLADEARTLARASGDELATAIALTATSYVLRTAEPRAPEMLERAVADAREASDVFERRDDSHWLALALDALAAAHADRAEYREALAAARRRMALIERLASPAERLHVAYTVPQYALPLGEIGEAIAAIREALALRVSGDDYTAGVSYPTGWLAILLWLRGEWDEALAITSANLVAIEALSTMRRRGVPFFDPALIGYLASYTCLAGIGIARRRERDDLAKELGAVFARHDFGGVGAALAAAEPARASGAIARVMTAGLDVWECERGLAILAAYRAAPPADAPLDEALAFADARGLRPIAAHLRRLRALVHPDAADLRTAHATLREIGLVPDAALAAVELASLTRDPALLEEAAATLAGLGDRPGLARVAEVRATLSP